MASLLSEISSLESIGPTPTPPPRTPRTPPPSYKGYFFPPILSSNWTDDHPQEE